MPTEKINLSSEVTEFLDQQNHPFRKEIEQLRHCILAASKSLAEDIKWNGPNYSIDGEDRITMKIQPPGRQVQLIFHRGAKKQEQPKERIIANRSKMLAWRENDRAIATFKSMQDIENGKAELTAIVAEWIRATRLR